MALIPDGVPVIPLDPETRQSYNHYFIKACQFFPPKEIPFFTKRKTSPKIASNTPKHHTHLIFAEIDRLTFGELFSKTTNSLIRSARIGQILFWTNHFLDKWKWVLYNLLLICIALAFEKFSDRYEILP